MKKYVTQNTTRLVIYFSTNKPALLSHFFLVKILPIFVIGGQHDDITVVMHGNVLGEFKRSKNEVEIAHVLQIASLWNYGIDYHKQQGGKAYSMRVRYYFDFVLIYLWDICPRYVASTSNAVKYQAIQPTLLKFKKEIDDFQKAADEKTATVE